MVVQVSDLVGRICVGYIGCAEGNLVNHSYGWEKGVSTCCEPVRADSSKTFFLWACMSGRYENTVTCQG
jgi:hypothetical protein